MSGHNSLSASSPWPAVIRQRPRSHRSTQSATSIVVMAGHDPLLASSPWPAAIRQRPHSHRSTQSATVIVIMAGHDPLLASSLWPSAMDHGQATCPRSLGSVIADRPRPRSPSHGRFPRSTMPTVMIGRGPRPRSNLSTSTVDITHGRPATHLALTCGNPCWPGRVKRLVADQDLCGLSADEPRAWLEMLHRQGPTHRSVQSRA